MTAMDTAKTLVVIEDNPGDQRLIQIKLRESLLPWTAVYCSCLKDGLAAVAKNTPDCLLVDLGLPDASGLEAVHRLKAAHPATALVVLTSLDDERVAQDAIRAGAQDYVAKSGAGLDLLPRVIRHAIERQQTQAALDSARRTRQALLDASHDSALLLDAAGRILTLNAHACDYLEKPADRLIGHDFFALLPPALAPGRRERFHHALSGQRTVEFEDSDGLRWFANRLLGVAGSGPDDHRCAVFVRDISSERAASVKLAEAKESADLANRAKTDFMARMSHDIRTPLNDVIGYAEMIHGESLGALQPAAYRDYARSITESGRQILRLMDHITDISMLESALVRDHASYRDLVELSPDLICVCVDGVIERINAAGVGMLRAPSSAACEGRVFTDFVHADDRGRFAGGLEALYAEEHPVPIKIVAYSGRERDIEVSAVPIRRETGNPAALVVGRDTTEITAAMRAVTAREHRIRAIMDTVLDAVITIDEHGIMQTANLSVERIFGYQPTELVGNNVTMLMPDPDASRHDGYLKRYLAGGGGTIIGRGREITGKRRDGTLFPAHLSVAELQIDRRRLFTGTIRDLSENKALAKRVAYLANHDPLTDLPNRTLLTDHLENALAQARIDGSWVALFTIDLAGFTTINDSMGHEAGNELLCDTARRVGQIAGVNGTAARLGGDEFALVLTGIKDDPALIGLADELHQCLEQPYQVEGTEMTVPADIGVAAFPRDGGDSFDLLRNAETALHAVRRKGGDRVGFFNAGMSQAATERLTLDRSLGEALRRGQFELYYQPQVRLSDYSLIGAEALIRWRHPELGLILPDRFIPVAEENGLIVPMGAWVLRTACAQMAAWDKAGLPSFRVGVNISGRQFRDPALVDQIAAAVAEAGIDPARLDLELTESVLMVEGLGTLETLRGLDRLGMRLSIDDFGTGYSSLAYLKRFPVDTIKIDRTFVMDQEHDDDDRAIAGAIISLARSLSLKTIAEGVETEAQAVSLARQGCDEIQGYLVSKPLPVAEFERFVQNHVGGRTNPFGGVP